MKPRCDWDATEKAKFIDRRSYVDVQGRHLLFGQDMEHVRKQCFERASGQCERCGKKVILSASSWRSMHMHHKTYRSKGRDDRLSNVESLCSACHAKEHSHGQPHHF